MREVTSPDYKVIIVIKLYFNNCCFMYNVHIELCVCVSSIMMSLLFTLKYFPFYSSAIFTLVLHHHSSFPPSPLPSLTPFILTFYILPPSSYSSSSLSFPNLFPISFFPPTIQLLSSLLYSIPPLTNAL